MVGSGSTDLTGSVAGLAGTMGLEAADFFLLEPVLGRLRVFAFLTAGCAGETPSLLASGETS